MVDDNMVLVFPFGSYLPMLLQVTLNSIRYINRAFQAQTMSKSLSLIPNPENSQTCAENFPVVKV